MSDRRPSLFRLIFSKKSLFRLVIIAILLVILAFVADLVVMPLYTKHGKEFDLVDVTDRTLTEAIEILHENGFEPVIQDSVYDEHFLPGSVIQQNPLPFSRVKRGRRVYLVVSIGEKPRYMPQLIGLTPQDAEFRLREIELGIRQVFYEFSDLYPRGVVFNQSVPSGEIAEKNQKVNITVSLGSAPTSLEIPNLVGKSLETVQKELEAMAVTVGKVKYVYRPKLVPGTILKQSVSPGTALLKVDSINLLVSTDQPPPDESKVDSLIQNFN